jgi:hypothetical protein
MALSQRFKEDRNELLILQDAVSVYHPLFGKTFDFMPRGATLAGAGD